MFRFIAFVFLLLQFQPGVYAAEIKVLDVGEGQSVLVHEKGRALLIDTGHAGQALKVLDSMSRAGVETLQAIILSHLHPDHASGYFRIRETYPEAVVYTSCHPLPKNIQPDITRWVYQALQSDTNHRCIKQGEQLNLAGLVVEVLWPATFNSNNLNHHSLVLQLNNQGEKILVMGDAGIQAEAVLLKSDQLETVNTLVVGHHGADDATSQAFLDAIKPAQAVISVNANNIRGYPSAKVIQRLEDKGIRLWRTDVSGDIDLSR